MLCACSLHLMAYFCFTANKKKASMKATGGGTAPESFTQAEELAIANNSGRPIMEGVEGGMQSDPGAVDMCSLYVQGNITLKFNSKMVI